MTKGSARRVCKINPARKSAHKFFADSVLGYLSGEVKVLRKEVEGETEDKEFRGPNTDVW